MFNQLKIEKLQSVFNCKHCSKLLENPIALPCGSTICESHITEIIENKKCQFCNEIHTIPNGGFQVNEAMNEMLKLKVNSIKLSPKFEKCNQLIKKVKRSENRIDQIGKDPENFIYEHFEAIKREVDLRRENLKKEIDEYSDTIIQDIHSTQTKCTEISKTVNKLTTDIQNLKDELNKEYNDFDRFDIDDDKYENILTNLKTLRPKFENFLNQYKNSLLNNEEHYFDHKQISIEQTFGKFFIKEKSFDSKILDKKNKRVLMNLCEFPVEQKWKLVYRGTRDGFGGIDFHSKCDSMRDTLTVIKTTSGNIFGGYVKEPWKLLTPIDSDNDDDDDDSMDDEDYYPVENNYAGPGEYYAAVDHYGQVYNPNNIFYGYLNQQEMDTYDEDDYEDDNNSASGGNDSGDDNAENIDYTSDRNAFIFSLKNTEGHSFKAKCKDFEHATYSSSLFGPVFGLSDICIVSDSNLKQDSYSSFGCSYEYDNNTYPSHILAGFKYFQTEEIEVFCMI